MDLLSVLLYLAIFGLIAWLIVTYIPMPAPVKQVVIVIMVIILIIYLLNLVGVGSGIRIGPS